MPPVTPPDASVQATSNGRSAFASALALAFSLGIGGVAPAEAYTSIDVAVRATNQSPATVFHFREAAKNAFHDGEEAGEKCELRAYRAAPKVFAALPEHARLADFAAALRSIESRLTWDAAARLAHSAATSFARPPMSQRASARGSTGLEQKRADVGAADFARQRRALAMLSTAQRNEYL